MKIRTLVAAATTALAIPLMITASASAAEREFSQRFSETTNGAIAYAGNTLATCKAADAGCTDARQGRGDKLNNNSWNMTRVNVLTGDGSATAASSAAISIPDGATILFAGLYWQARSTKVADTNAKWRVTLTGPNGRSASVTASSRDSIGAGTYAAFAEVTPAIESGGAGNYTVSDVIEDVDAVDRFGGWALVVAYKSLTEPARNLVIYDGAREVSSGAKSTITIPVSGFLTPPSGTVSTQVGFVAGEGDLASTGDYVKLDGTPLQNALNPPNNVANSTVSRLGTEVTDRNPAYPNQLGWDVDTFNGDGILANGATSATLTATTSGETYYPQVLSLATEVYAPEVDLVKSVTDLNGGQVQRGDVLEYTVVATNTGRDAATNAVLRDPVPGSTDYVPGSITVDGVPAADAVFDGAGAYYPGSAEVLAALGGNAVIPAGGTLRPGATSTVTFRAVVRDSVPNGGTVTNRARADYNSATTGQRFGSESNLVPASITAPDLTITKTATSVQQLGAATWTLQVRNVGGTRLTSDVLVTDAIPAGVTNVAASGSGWLCEAISGQVVCQRPGPVDAGDTLPRITVTGRVGSVERAVNVTRVTSAQDQNTENDYGMTENVFGVNKTNVDFGTTITLSDRRPVAGDRITATATFTHYDGVPSPSRVEISFPTTINPLSAIVTGSAEGACTISGYTVVCEVGTLSEGESIKVVIASRVGTGVSGGTTIVSSIQPTGAFDDPAQGNNTSSVIVGVLPPEPAIAPPTSIAVTKALASGTPVFDGATTWSVRVSNTGGGTAESAYFQDQLPAIATLVSATDADGRPCTVRGQVIRCEMGSLAPGQSATARITARYAVIGEITNGVTAYANGGVRARASASATIEGARVGTRIITPKRWPIAGRANATVRISGAGPLTARGSRLTVTIPKGVRVISAKGFRITRKANGTTVLTRATGNLKTGARRAFPLVLGTPRTASTVRLRSTASAANAANANSSTPAISRRGTTPVTG